MYEVVDKPWGRYVVLYSDKTMWLKRLIINSGQALSLQSHQQRTEFWVTEDQGVSYQIDGMEGQMLPGKIYEVLPGDKHRLWNTCADPVVVIEWVSGAPDEQDIIRYDDNYGRT